MPRDITVTFGDGSSHVYKGAPDDVTPDAVQARAEKEFGKSVSALDGGRPAAAAPMAQPRGTVPSEEPRSVGGFLSNIGPSAGKFFGGLAEAVTSPVKTAGTLLDIPIGAAAKAFPKAFEFINSLDTPEGQAAAKRAADTASAVGGFYGQRYGSLEGIKKAAYEDPVGVAGDLSALLSMGAGAVRAVPAAAATGFKVAKAVPAFQGQAALTTMPQQIAAIAQPTANALEAAARYTNPLQPVSSGLSAIGKAMGGTPQTPQMQEAIKAAREVGYVVPPTQARDSVINKLIEGTAGKASTGQAASVKNQTVTNRLANETIGLAPDVQLTPAVLDSVRAEAGKAYQAVAKLGDFDVTGGVKLPAEVNVRSVLDPYIMTYGKKVDAGELVRAWKQSNADATAYYRAYGRDANPETLAKAKQAADSAKQIDSFLNDQLKSAGMTDLLDDLKAARVQIAKTYSIEDALNPVTGNVDAKKLASRFEKGKSLSGGLETAGRFASQFKQAVRTPEAIGSAPGISPLDVFAASGLSAATGSPAGMIAAYGRPLARSAALSNLVQNRLIQTPSGPSRITPEQINYLNSLLQAQQAQGTQ